MNFSTFLSFRNALLICLGLPCSFPWIHISFHSSSILTTRSFKYVVASISCSMYDRYVALSLYIFESSCYNYVMINVSEHKRDEYKDITDFPPEKCLQVNNCGTKKNYGLNYTLFRPKGRKDYYLLYIARGWLDIEMNHEMVRVEKGECVVFLPDTPQTINFSSQGNPTFFYVHFAGNMATETISALKLANITLCAINDKTMVEILFNQMVQAFLPLKALSGRQPISVPKVNGLLLQLLDLLAQSITEKVKPEQDAINSAMLYLSEHFREKVDLHKCASLCHLSLSRFAHLFKIKLGISPYRFVLSLRIDEAKDLLLYSSMNVSEVSENVGISDPSYFSRLFRRYTGYSPSDYRKHAQ